MKTFKVVKDHNTQARNYREGQRVELGEIAARSLLQRGVIEPFEEEESVGSGESQTEPEETPESSSVGPSETKVDVSPVSPEEGSEYTEEWLEGAQEALESDNGNAFRSAVAEVAEGDTSKRKDENRAALEAHIEEAKKRLEG